MPTRAVLGLPEKDYYLRTDAKSEETRKQYVQHLANMLKLLGEPGKAQSDAQGCDGLETAMAKSSMGTWIAVILRISTT